MNYFVVYVNYIIIVITWARGVYGIYTVETGLLALARL